MKEKIQLQKKQNLTIEQAVKKQIDAFMNFVQEEKKKESRIRAQVIDLTRENKKLKTQMQSEQIKGQLAGCTDCQMLKQKLKKCQDETDHIHELYLGQKQ